MMTKYATSAPNVSKSIEIVTISRPERLNAK